MTQQEIDTAVAAVVEGRQIQIFTVDMELMIADGITLREAIRLAFQQLGVEVEFSGRGTHERGVVIDLDPDHMVSLNLDPDLLRFGQTVVRVTA
ncbi:hypothetical protein [Mucilaginibacter sp. PAMB04168]|uniref:hypothetical protein n=1 Tax=Mucilaginibacter sp. PAMB04168 TaxID=3138567 RepID=UPI0031F69551